MEESKMDRPAFVPETATLNQFGNFEWQTEAGGVTFWEYDPDTGLTRHCGEGPGAFWTDWE